jgi:hypothetical protein
VLVLNGASMWQDDGGAYVPEVLLQRDRARVVEVRLYGADYVLDVAVLAPRHTGTEGLWSDEHHDWIGYAPREGTAAFGGVLAAELLWTWPAVNGELGTALKLLRLGKHPEIGNIVNCDLAHIRALRMSTRTVTSRPSWPPSRAPVGGFTSRSRNWWHDFSLGAVVRGANGVLAAEVHIVGPAEIEPRSQLPVIGRQPLGPSASRVVSITQYASTRFINAGVAGGMAMRSAPTTHLT